MGKVILKNKGAFWVVGDDVVHQLKSLAIRPAFKEALELFPDVDTTSWVDENNVTQPVLFGVEQ